MERLKRRADFLAAASGNKASAAGFLLQARVQDQGQAMRVGFTVSKRTGNAVERNRIRRRLREIVRLNGPSDMKAGHDYVLIGRRDALTLPFTRMTAELTRALKRVHAGSKAART